MAKMKRIAGRFRLKILHRISFLERIVIFIGRGRPTKGKEERLNMRFTLRTNDFEGEQLMFLAQKSGVSVNSYIRELIMKDYQKYRSKKINDAEAQLWN